MVILTHSATDIEIVRGNTSTSVAEPGNIGPTLLAQLPSTDHQIHIDPTSETRWRVVGAVFASLKDAGFDTITFVGAEQFNARQHDPNEPPYEPLGIVLQPGDDGETRFWVNARQTWLPDGDYRGLRLLLEGWLYDETQNPTGIYKATVPVLVLPAPSTRWKHITAVHDAIVKAGYEILILFPLVPSEVAPLLQ